MSTRFDVLEDNSIIHPPADAGCSVCGDRGWQALWRGELLLLICPTCAIHVLPCLLADALWSPTMSPLRMDHALNEFHARFWRAYALAIVRSSDRTR